jgi:flotillin
LVIGNANVEDLKDFEGNLYFENLKQKALEAASNETKIAVSEARKQGNIGEKEREVDTRKQRSILEANAFEVETTNSQRLSDYDRLMKITLTNNARELELTKITAHQETETRRIEVESNLNRALQVQELERLRKDKIITATAESEATIKLAEADVAATRLRADAHLYTKMREAEGTQATLEASAEGLRRIYEVSAGNPEMASFYMALERGVFDRDGLFTTLAEKQAKAIYEMKPKINIWNTGSGGSDDYTKVIAGLAKSIPPILDAIQDQTQIKLPDFLSKSPHFSEIPEISPADAGNIRTLLDKYGGNLTTAKPIAETKKTKL